MRPSKRRSIPIKRKRKTNFSSKKRKATKRKKKQISSCKSENKNSENTKSIELNQDIKLREKIKIDDYFIYECEESESDESYQILPESHNDIKQINTNSQEESFDFNTNKFQLNYLQDSVPQVLSTVPSELLKLPQFIPHQIKQNFNILLQNYPYLWDKTQNNINSAPIDLSLFSDNHFGKQSVLNQNQYISDIYKNFNFQNACEEKKCNNFDIPYNNYNENLHNEKYNINENEIIQEPSVPQEMYEDMILNENKCLEEYVINNNKEGSYIEKIEDSSINLNSSLLISNKLQNNNDVPLSNNQENNNFSTYIRKCKIKKPLTKPCILCGEAHFEKHEILKFTTVSEFLNTINIFLEQRLTLDSHSKINNLAEEFDIPNYTLCDDNYQNNKLQWEKVLHSFNQGEFKQENTFKRTKRFCKRCIYLKMEEYTGMDTLFDAIHEEDEQAVLDVKKKEEIIRNIKEFFSTSKEKIIVRDDGQEIASFCPQEENHYQDGLNFNKKSKKSEKLNAFNIFDNIFGRKKLTEETFKMFSDKYMNRFYSDKSEKNDDDESSSESDEYINQNQSVIEKNVYDSLIEQFGGNLNFMNDISHSDINNLDNLQNKNLNSNIPLENNDSYSKEKMFTNWKNENSKFEETKFNCNNPNQSARYKNTSHFISNNSQLGIEKAMSLNEIILLYYKIVQQYNKSISFTQFQKLIIYTVFFMLDQYISQYQNIISMQTKTTMDILDYLDNINTSNNSELEESLLKLSEEQKRVVLLNKIYSKSLEILNVMNDKISQMKSQCKF
jgi:hypothetical protein